MTLALAIIFFSIALFFIGALEAWTLVGHLILNLILIFFAGFFADKVWGSDAVVWAMAFWAVITVLTLYDDVQDIRHPERVPE